MLNRFFTALPRETRDTLFLLAVIAWVIAMQVGHIPWWCTALAAGVRHFELVGTAPAAAFERIYARPISEIETEKNG